MEHLNALGTPPSAMVPTVGDADAILLYNDPDLFWKKMNAK